MQEYYKEIKNLVIEWIENNQEKYLGFFGDDEIRNISKEILAEEEYEYIKKNDSWGGDIQINILCVILKLTIAVFKNQAEKLADILYLIYLAQRLKKQ